MSPWRGEAFLFACGTGRTRRDTNCTNSHELKLPTNQTRSNTIKPGQTKSNQFKSNQRGSRQCDGRRAPIDRFLRWRNPGLSQMTGWQIRVVDSAATRLRPLFDVLSSRARFGMHPRRTIRTAQEAVGFVIAHDLALDRVPLEGAPKLQRHIGEDATNRRSDTLFDVGHGL